VILFFVCLSFLVIGYLFNRLKSLNERLRTYLVLEEKLKKTEEELSCLRIREASLKERLSFALEMEQKFQESFKLISLEVLEKNQKSFFDLAKGSFDRFQQGANEELERKKETIQQLVLPVKETLAKLDFQLHHIADSERLLRQETANLVKALHSSNIRGRWGEVQLRRVVELAGMVPYCDFVEQEIGGEGSCKPDLTIRLPGERYVVIDAKAPLDAYLEAIEATDEKLKELKLKEHAKQVRAHVQALGKKAYWEQFQPSPEFVILFLPAETFYSAALEHDPALLEMCTVQNVMIATPTTLIALLKAVAYGWKQENLSLYAKKTSELGHELYKRLIDMTDHLSKMGRGLSQAVDAYNRATGSFETRVLVTARKFKETGASPMHLEIESLEPLEKVPREVYPQE